MVHVLVRLLIFQKLGLNLPSHKPTIKDEGSIPFISCNEDYLSSDSCLIVPTQLLTKAQIGETDWPK